MSSYNKIRQSASQMMLCVFFYTPCWRQNTWEWWKLAIIFASSKICNVALTPVCIYDTIPYVALLIEEKLSNFIELYPRSWLKPKFHYMIHYPMQIAKFGPLRQCGKKVLSQDVVTSKMLLSLQQKSIDYGSATKCKWIPHSIMQILKQARNRTDVN